VKQTLEQLAAEGKLRDVNPTVATFSLFGMILWISRWYRRDGELTPHEVLADFHKLALSAVLRTESVRSAEKVVRLS